VVTTSPLFSFPFLRSCVVNFFSFFAGRFGSEKGSHLPPPFFFCRRRAFLVLFFLGCLTGERNHLQSIFPPSPPPFSLFCCERLPLEGKCRLPASPLLSPANYFFPSTTSEKIIKGFFPRPLSPLPYPEASSPPSFFSRSSPARRLEKG